ncbi:chromate transporter [Halomonas denitrificans]|uniref:chromate transporter n=1 Tax=Halomonas TaxID=2745 RepID=UPI001A8EC006|nr:MULTISPECIES: chromate transporter [Halomonas]MED5296216.1 chromate transporter [Pseudomonadota bacterium]MBN8410631.1 chromate transporter [Halomonas litopenaei]MBY5925731.1 chromate transporter [Halomonas sp. DP4Y7-2]MBY5969230.1 chromate transporter [Halomonas denitrificans]MBY5984860.1 chromate transporter [Halomonas sp. DP5Y7-2]
MGQHASLFAAFFRIGIFGFGGGPSMIPLVHQEVVKRHAWMDDDAFADVLAIGNTLPGPIATKMAGYIGFRVGGVLGAINAVVAVIVPVIFAMIALLGLYSRYGDQRWVQGMGLGVVPVVMVMMAQLTFDFFNKSRAGLGVIATLVLGGVAGGLIYGLGVHPGLVIGALLVAALLRPEASRKASQGGPSA